MGKLVSICAIIIGSVGMVYSFVIIGVLTGYMPPEWALAANVVLGAPLIAAGIVITIDGWYRSIKSGSVFGIIISIWNSIATFWNIKVWYDSFKMASEMGGVKSLLNRDSSGKGNAIGFLLVAVVVSLLLSAALFRAGLSRARR